MSSVQPAVQGFDETDPRPPTSDTQPDSGIYVYSIIECQEPRTFGKIGIGGRGDEVYTVHYKDLAAVVSRTPLVVYDPTRENVLAHEHINEVSIEEGFTPVPMSFGTLFKTEKDIVEFLEDTYDALRDVLVKMKDKLEFGLRVNWAREEVLAEFCNHFEKLYEEALSGSRRPFEQWRSRLVTLGKRVTAERNGLPLFGRAVDVEDDGALIVEREDGGRERVEAGDVFLVRT